MKKIFFAILLVVFFCGAAFADTEVQSPYGNAIGEKFRFWSDKTVKNKKLYSGQTLSMVVERFGDPKEVSRGIGGTLFYEFGDFALIVKDGAVTHIVTNK